MKTYIVILLAIILCSQCNINGQDQANKIAILPFNTNGIDSIYSETAEGILRVEIGKQSVMDIISAKRTRDIVGSDICYDKECALEIGQTLGASQVFSCILSALGDKIIIQYFLVDVPSKREVLIDHITASNIEEMDVVMKRIAKSIVDLEPAAKSAEVGKILISESKAPLSRSSRKNFGVMFGYLYPQNGYDNSERSFTANLRWDYEVEDYAVGMLIGARKGFAMNLYSSYLFSRKDVCPYIGGSFGFHWVNHSHSYRYDPYNYSYYEDNRKSDGFEIGAHTGLRLWHTYNFQVVVNLEYTYSFNDYEDQAIIFTLGIL